MTIIDGLTREDDFRERLTEYLEAVLDAQIEIETLQPLGGGTSRDNWQVGVKIADQPLKQFILRRDLATSMNHKALEREQEFLLIQVAHASGVNVPRPCWYCVEPMILDAPFLIMDYVEGISSGSQVVNSPELAEARKVLPQQLGEQLARIHALNPNQTALDFLPRPRPGFSPAQEAISQTRTAIIGLGVHIPAFEFGLRWAQQHAPSCENPVVLHGDFRVGNFLVSSKGLNGIIDWEFSRVGDPLEDIAWLCLRDWRYGQGRLHLGGIAPRQAFIATYEQASGRKVDLKAVAFWEIFGNLRLAVTSLSQANRHLSGGDASVELASLGRRSAEMQLEMLRLIAQQEVDSHV